MRAREATLAVKELRHAMNARFKDLERRLVSHIDVRLTKMERLRAQQVGSDQERVREQQARNENDIDVKIYQRLKQMGASGTKANSSLSKLDEVNEDQGDRMFVSLADELRKGKPLVYDDEDYEGVQRLRSHYTAADGLDRDMPSPPPGFSKNMQITPGTSPT